MQGETRSEKGEPSSMFTNILSKRSEAERLISTEHANLQIKLKNIKKLIEEEKKKTSIIQLEIADLDNKTVTTVNELDQIKIKIKELKEECIKVDSELDKMQTKKLKVETILCKEEKTIENYFKDLLIRQHQLDSYCDSLPSENTVKHLEDKKHYLQQVKLNLHKELEKLHTNCETEKSKLQIDIRVLTNKTKALKKLVEKKTAASN